ncbi:D-amino acid dehydrogenase [Sediminicurvatus halobius]|uniref:Amino acid oxidase n=1 Tax=Sediminicurvatus halobius TaxID=2182432 RepID=A0A2U2N9G4_9GAMM|nr:D-amino acid dehydrogenase [Spiribacter halobius]PWG65722.1 amino acid oxidase [Spiribacter halobius]UEX77756.1 D-amino acid dehydrogenase [Spiribacter halobius]
MRVLVIGGGVIGTTTAWFLVHDGHEVTLIEREPALAAEGSHANGGMLHASHTEPWNSPAAIRQLLRWLGREDSPLLLRPTQIPRLAGWGLGFLRYSRAHHHARNTQVNARLAVYSLEVMRALRTETGLHYDDSAGGILKIFRSAAELATALRTSELMAALGVDFEQLDTAGVVAREPALSDVRDELCGGLFYPQDEIGDARLFTERLGALAAERGAEIRLGERVQRLERDGDRIGAVVTDQCRHRADAYVLATGAEAPLLARQAGLRLPIRPVKGYSATLDVGGKPGAPSLPIIDDGRKIVMSRLGDRLRIAGTAEFAGYDREIRPQRVQTVIRQGLASFPRLAAAVDPATATPWACLRPMTMDGPPILGATPVRNLFLNTGPGHLGWTFAAGAGRVVADVVQGCEPAISLEGLGLERYRG